MNQSECYFCLKKLIYIASNQLPISFTTLTEKDARRILESEVFFTKIGKNLQNKLQIVKISHSYVYTVRSNAIVFCIS